MVSLIPPKMKRYALEQIEQIEKESLQYKYLKNRVKRVLVEFCKIVRFLSLWFREQRSSNSTLKAKGRMLN